MKKVFLIAAVLSALAVTTAKAEDTASAPLGVTVGGTYVSNYLFRGLYFFGKGEGAFLPMLSYNILGSGLTFGAAMEISDNYVLEKSGKDSSPAGYTYQSLDLGLSYSKEFKPVTIALAVWYWDYYKSTENSAPNASFLTNNISATAGVFLNPMVAFTYDYYFDKDYAADGKSNNKDYYLQFGISHNFELTKEVGLKLSSVGGYYNQKTAERKGLSDITSTVAAAITKDAVVYTSTFNYVYIPSGDFRKVDSKDYSKFFATFGAAYSF